MFQTKFSSEPRGGSSFVLYIVVVLRLILRYTFYFVVVKSVSALRDSSGVFLSSNFPYGFVGAWCAGDLCWFGRRCGVFVLEGSALGRASPSFSFLACKKCILVKLFRYTVLVPGSWWHSGLQLSAWFVFQLSLSTTDSLRRYVTSLLQRACVFLLLCACVLATCSGGCPSQ